jgi:PTS system mannitol-specific IIC component
VGAAASCLVAVPILRFAGSVEGDDTALAQARDRVLELKAKATAPAVPPRPVTVYFACEAGMGSSVLGVSIFKTKLEKAGIEVEVAHAAVHELPPSAEVVITHSSLSARVREVAPGAAVYAVDDLVRSPVYDELIEILRPQGTAAR